MPSIQKRRAGLELASELVETMLQENQDNIIRGEEERKVMEVYEDRNDQKSTKRNINEQLPLKKKKQKQTEVTLQQQTLLDCKSVKLPECHIWISLKDQFLLMNKV
jgi:hypothetical protein